MADKFRRVIPLRITMADGEQPTAQKITAIGEQVRVGLSIVERALGDLWNQSGDSVLLNTPLQIPNLARIIGQNRELNPTIFPPKDEFLYTEYLGSKFENLTEGHLLFPPKSSGWYDATNSAGIFSSAVQQKTTESDVQIAGDWWVDTETGRFRTGTPLTTSDILAYYVDPDADWHMTDEVLPGVIPDPRQADFEYLRVSEPVAGTYYIHLPPRRPLALTNREAPGRYPPTGGSEQTANEGTGTSAPWKFWHDSGTASAAEFYRYQLPKEIQDQWGSYSSGDQLPVGFLWLYDTATQTVIEDALFYYPATGNPWVLQVSSDTFDFSALVSADETEPSYNSGLVLITAGAPLARVIANLAVAKELHQHDGSSVLDMPISHESLLDMDPPTSDYTGESHDSQYPGYLPPWGGSQWAKDNHVSLLSRVGAHASTPRDQYNNAMLGDLLMGNADTSGSDDYVNNALPDNSFKMVFGDTDGSFVRGSPGGQVQVNSIEDDILKLTNDNTVEEWDFTLKSSFDDDGALVIHRSANTKRFALGLDGTVFMGSNHNGSVLTPPTNSAVVIRAENYPVLTTYDGNSNSRGASLLTMSSGESFLSCAEDFADNNRTGNSFMNIGGHDGVRLRYGSIGSGPQNKGTIGLELDSAGLVSTTGDLDVTSGVWIGETLNVTGQSFLGEYIADPVSEIGGSDTRLEVRGTIDGMVTSRIHNASSGSSADARLELMIEGTEFARIAAGRDTEASGLDIRTNVWDAPVTLWSREADGSYLKSLHLAPSGRVHFNSTGVGNPTIIGFYVEQEADPIGWQSAFFEPNMPAVASRNFMFGKSNTHCINLGYLHFNNTSTNTAIFAMGGSAASNDALYLTGAGNVGLGVTQPVQRLDVSGNVLVRGNDSSVAFGPSAISTVGSGTVEHIHLDWIDLGGTSRLDLGGVTSTGATQTMARFHSDTTSTYKAEFPAGATVTNLLASSGFISNTLATFFGVAKMVDAYAPTGEEQDLRWQHTANPMDPQNNNRRAYVEVYEDFLGNSPATPADWSSTATVAKQSSQANGVVRLSGTSSLLVLSSSTTQFQDVPGTAVQWKHVDFRMKTVANGGSNYTFEIGLMGGTIGSNFSTALAGNSSHISFTHAGNGGGFANQFFISGGGGAGYWVPDPIEWGTDWVDLRIDISNHTDVRLYYRKNNIFAQWIPIPPAAGNWSITSSLYYTPYILTQGHASAAIDLDMVFCTWTRT